MPFFKQEIFELAEATTNLNDPTYKEALARNHSLSREQGIDAVVVNWAGVLGAKGLTREQTAFWDNVFTKTTSTEQWQKEMARQQWDAELLTSAPTAAYLKSDYAKLSAALNDLGLAKKP